MSSVTSWLLEYIVMGKRRTMEKFDRTHCENCEFLYTELKELREKYKQLEGKEKKEEKKDVRKRHINRAS